MKYLRLKKNSDFQKVFRRGKKVFSPYITLLYYPSNETTFGIAISKKYGKAVKRNRIKRLIRASFAKSLPELNGAYTIVALPKISEEYTFENFEKGIKSWFGRMNQSQK